MKTTAKTINFTASDGLIVTADLYVTQDKAVPFIILFHQAGSSRGEYLEIAPRLNQLGFNCMAVDARSGGSFAGIANQTAKAAKRAKKPAEYTDAFTDLEAALLYVKNELKPGKIIAWGSSYSASLVMVMAEKYANLISGILGFSPGKYFQFEGRDINQFSAKWGKPVFITSAPGEKSNWQDIFESIPAEHKVSFLPPNGGKHGSSALLKKTKNNQAYWKAVEEFLKQFR